MKQCKQKDSAVSSKWPSLTSGPIISIPPGTLKFSMYSQLGFFQCKDTIIIRNCKLRIIFVFKSAVVPQNSRTISHCQNWFKIPMLVVKSGRLFYLRISYSRFINEGSDVQYFSNDSLVIWL